MLQKVKEDTFDFFLVLHAAESLRERKPPPRLLTLGKYSL